MTTPSSSHQPPATQEYEIDDAYFEKYLQDSTFTVSAEPSLNLNALKSQIGPSIPTTLLNQVQPSSSSSSSIRYGGGAAPYPEGYKKPVDSSLYTSNLAAYKTGFPKQEQTKKTTPTTYIAKADTDRKATILRQGGGAKWSDPTLVDWDENDYRIFVGNLGNEVSDELLNKSFSQYKSLQKARVIRDRKTAKTKGYGFVSFKDPQDFLKALKEMNGKVVGYRPIEVRKSEWADRNVDTGKDKKKRSNGGVSKK